MKYVWHGIDPGIILRYRKVEDTWQYEAQVRFGCEHGKPEWIPVIELVFHE